MDDIQHCTFSARLDCHYLLRPAHSANGRTLLVVALHGFSQNAETMLGLTAKMFGPAHVIASLQGPNQFFINGNTQEVGFGWGAKRHSASAIRLHHEMVSHVLDEAGRAYAIPPQRRLLVGFSQPVSYNYRFAATCPEAVRGVVGICGGLPSDWETASYQQVTAALLHIARRGDEFYPSDVTERYAERLRLRARDVEFYQLDGGHRFPSKGTDIVEKWIQNSLRGAA